MTAHSASRYVDGPRLLADVGAVHLRLALETAPGVFEAETIVPASAYATLQDALQTYLAGSAAGGVQHAALSLPNPITGDQIKLTNHPWEFSVEAMRRHLGLRTLVVVNDYCALAMGLTRLEVGERMAVGGGEAVAGGVIGVIGPGTGLGVSALLPASGRALTLASEGGHVSYPPQDEDETWIVAQAQQRFGHASGERLISAAGLALMHQWLTQRDGVATSLHTAPDITAAALASTPDPAAQRTLDIFCAMLGTVAGNLALTLGSTGGLYIGGAIVPRILPFFARSRFRERFEQKGRFQPWLARIPTWVIDTPNSALRGASALLDDHLSADHGASSLLADIRMAMERLSASERLVAQDVLSAPRAWMSDPIVRIAERCGVSTPTVMRFCRSMGFKGLADFKLRLGSGLSGSMRVSHSDVQSSDPPAERMGKILNNSISALILLRDRLHPEVFERAIHTLLRARRIEIYAVGNAAATAEDAQDKLGRLGLPAIARTDPMLQSLSAAFLGPEDTVLVLSNSGAIESVNDAVARARRTGATVIAMCPQRSELARLADVVLPVEHPDDTQSVVPMVSRLMQSVILDVLVSDLALQRRSVISAALEKVDDHRFGTLSSHSR